MRNTNILLNLMSLKFQKGFSAILVVILMVFSAGLVLGGIYYYTEVYQPAQYAKTVIPLFDNLEKGHNTESIFITAVQTGFTAILCLQSAKKEV